MHKNAYNNPISALRQWFSFCGNGVHSVLDFGQLRSWIDLPHAIGVIVVREKTDTLNLELSRCFSLIRLR